MNLRAKVRLPFQPSNFATHKITVMPPRLLSYIFCRDLSNKRKKKKREWVRGQRVRVLLKILPH
jgi:hypothetical protein